MFPFQIWKGKRVWGWEMMLVEEPCIRCGKLCVPTRLGLGSVTYGREGRTKADVRKIMSATLIITHACVKSHEIGNLIREEAISYSFQ